MKTEHKQDLIKRMEEDNKEWKVEVINAEQGNTVITEFDSKQHTFENVLHKVELDLMTNLHFEFIDPIKIRIKEIMN